MADLTARQAKPVNYVAEAIARKKKEKMSKEARDRMDFREEQRRKEREEDRLQGLVVLHETSSWDGKAVKKYPDNTAVKTKAHMDEAGAQRLAVQLGIPVPRVHEALTTSTGDVNIRMDFVEGDRLDKLWPGMSAEEKQDIAAQLRQILTTMQSIPPPNSTIGSCVSGLARDCRFYDTHIGGPFHDEEGFNGFLLDLAESTPKIFRNALSQRIRSGHRIVFTHGDLAQHNIIVKDNKITGLIDWEYAGWYPEYWDFVKFFQRPSSHDWKDYAEEIFPRTYDDELMLYQVISHYQNQWRRGITRDNSE